MNRSFFFLTIFLCLFGCKKEVSNNSKEATDVVFNSNKFKVVIDSFIMDTNIYPTNGYNSILGYLSISGSDTILTLKNCPPYEKENLVFTGNYSRYNFSFYAPRQLESKLKEYISYDKTILDDIDMEIQSNDIDVVYESSYIINNKEINREVIPLELSTDSIN